MTSKAGQVADYLRKAQVPVVREQVAIARIPCMSYRAAERAAYYVKALRAADLKPRYDKVGNVIAERPGTSPSSRPTLIVSAHLDSVFHGLKPIKVRRRGSIYHAPGICDDAAGVADLILLARALKRLKVETAGDIIFVASVGEESGHEVWGMEHFWKESRLRDPWFISIDGAIPGRIVTRSLATWSPTITIKGPGGHSYVSFGRPNPVHVLSRIVVKLESMKLDRSKDASYNANMVSGGTAPNVIPKEASVTLNIRSSDMKLFESMRKKVYRFIEEARKEELAWATSEKRLSIEMSAHGRPGGRVAEDNPLVAAATRAFKAEGLKPAYTASSTDANMPMSLGVPAITISAGGRAENMHSTDEWHDMTGRTRELAGLGRIVLAVAG